MDNTAVLHTSMYKQLAGKNIYTYFSYIAHQILNGMPLKCFKSLALRILICNCFKYCVSEHYAACVNYLITVLAIFLCLQFSHHSGWENGKCTHGHRHTHICFLYYKDYMSFCTPMQKKFMIFIFLGWSLSIFNFCYWEKRVNMYMWEHRYQRVNTVYSRRH